MVASKVIYIYIYIVIFSTKLPPIRSIDKLFYTTAATYLNSSRLIGEAALLNPSHRAAIA